MNLLSGLVATVLMTPPSRSPGPIRAGISLPCSG
jgi:hypothetical protein